MRNIGIILVCLAVLSANLTSQSSFLKIFNRFEFLFDYPIEDIFTEDLNKDSLKDLLVITKSTDDKLLQIFFQKKDGFTSAPDQVLNFDKRAIVFDTGDIVDNYPGKEIVFLTSDSISYYFMQDNLYNSQPEKLMDVSSILQSASPESPVRCEFIFDLENESSNVLLIPEPEHTTLFLKEQNEDLKGNQRIRLKPLFTTSSPYRLQEEDSELERFSQKIILQVPKIYFDDFNGDKNKDIVSIFKDKIEVFLHKEYSEFSPEPDFKVDLEVLTEEEKKKAIQPVFKVDAIEINNDGLLDILVTKSTIKTTTGMTKIYIHLNRNGEIKSIPDQIVVLDSSLGYPEILDLNGDRHKDLIIAELKIGLLQIIKILITKKVNYQEGIYLGKDGKFPQIPDFKLKSQIRFDFENTENIEGEILYFDGDFNGDGVNDLLISSSNKNKLYIFRGNLKREKMYQKKAEYEIEEPLFPRKFFIEDLNNDKVSDLIFDFRKIEKKKAVVFLSK